MDMQFSTHAIDRVQNRYSHVVTYGEVQAAVMARVCGCNVRPGKLEIKVKKLPHSTKVVDPTMFMTGYACGDTIIAKCIIRNDGCYIDTIVLR